MNKDDFTICPLSGAIHAKTKECSGGGIVAAYVFSTDDLKKTVIQDGAITKIQFKRKGTYGHRSKEGPRYFGREVIKYDYEK